MNIQCSGMWEIIAQVQVWFYVLNWKSDKTNSGSWNKTKIHGSAWNITIPSIPVFSNLVNDNFL